MSQASPAMTNVAPTPVQAHTMHPNARPMNAQHAAYMASHNQARQAALRQQVANRTQGSPPMGQMQPALSAVQQQAMVARSQQQAQLRANNMGQDGAFRPQMQNMAGGQMPNGQFGSNGGMPGQQQQTQQQQFNGQQQANMMARQLAVQYLHQMKAGALAQQQVITPELEKAMHLQATQKAREAIRLRINQQSGRLRQQQQQQQQQQMMMNNGAMNGGYSGLNGGRMMGPNGGLG